MSFPVLLAMKPCLTCSTDFRSFCRAHILNIICYRLGFLTSSPAERIDNEDAVRWMIGHYKTLHHDSDDMVFTAFPREKDVKLRIFKGTQRALRGHAFHI